MSHFSPPALLRYVLGVGVLLLWSAYAQATTTITSLTASPTNVAPGEVVTVTAAVQTTALRSLSGDASLILKRDGAIVSEDTIAGFLDAVDLQTGSLVRSIALPPNLYATPGDYTVELAISGLEDGQISVADSATTSFVVEAPVVPVAVAPSSLSLEGRAGETVSGSFTITSGSGPFSLGASAGTLSQTTADLGESITYSYSIPASEPAGSQLSASITVSPASGTAATVPVTIRVSTPLAQAITVQPASLTLSGAASETPTASFTITSGTPPFSLTSANEEGRGSFSSTTPGLNETVTYGFRIPGTATDRQEFTDLITVTGADGAVTTVLATIIAQVSDGGAPTQSEIDEAMQAIAQTPPERATAAVISKICPAGVVEPRLQEDCNVVVGAALAPDDSVINDQASQALGQVTADQVSAPVTAAQTSVLSQIRNVGSRIAALRTGATGFSARGLSFNLDGQSLPAGQIADSLVRDLVGGTGGAAGDPMDFGPWGVFVNGTISSGDKDPTENVAGFDYDAWSVTLGVDYRFSDNLVAGTAFGYSKNETDIDSNGGNLDTDGYNVSLYGTYYLESGLYLDAIATYGWSDYDQRRNIRYDIGPVSVDQAAKSDFDGSQWSASFGGGYSFSRSAWSFGPTARLEYVKTDVDGFQERMSNPSAAGGGWATSIDDQDVSSFTSQLGGEVSYALSTSWGVLLPSAHLEWVHEFEDGADNVVGHFIQDTSGTRFSLPTDEFDRDYFNLRLGLSAQFAEGRSGFIYYRKLFGYSDLDAYTIGAGLRLEF